MMYNVITSNNKCIVMCGKLALYGSNSTACNNLNYIAHKYKLCKYALKSASIGQILKGVNISNPLDDGCLTIVGAIREFVHMAENKHSRDREEAKQIVSYLCLS